MGVANFRGNVWRRLPLVRPLAILTACCFTEVGMLLGQPLFSQFEFKQEFESEEAAKEEEVMGDDEEG